MRRILLVIGIIIAVAVWRLRLRFPFDDAFISFRYAEHVAQGHGLVWNIGGPHTEGFTNLLFVLLLAAVNLVSSHLLEASQTIGVATTIATGILIFSITADLRNWRTGLVATGFFWLTPLTWVNALSGMETSLFVMLCVAVLWFANLGRYYLAFAAATLATLTRPEGALLGIILFVILTSTHLPSKKTISRTNVFFPARQSTVSIAFFAFVLPLLLYAAWKFWYFGDLLPNSFYIKVSDRYSTALPGVQYVRLFVISTLVLIVLTVGIRRWKHSIILIASIWALLLLVFYMFVFPLEGLYDRFLWPVFAIFCITGATGTHDFAEWRKLHPFGVFAIVVLGMQVTLSILTPRSKQALTAHEEVWDAGMDPIVRELRRLPDFDSIHFAYGDAGYVVYKSGIDHIDLFGLNDTRIARARTIAERALIVKSERPDILLLPVYSQDTCEAWVEDAYGLARTLEFSAVASTGAFPFRLVWVLDTASPYYTGLKREIVNRIGVPGSGIDPAPPLCYSTR